MEKATLTLGPIRWQDTPSRIVIGGQEPPQVFFQVTADKGMEELCRRRPAEALPRIAPLLGRTHHLAAAAALDDLYGAAPPASAAQVRNGLLQAQYFHSHLRRIFLLLTHWVDPLIEYRAAAHCPGPARSICAVSAEIMHHVALAQEAETILGGRAEYPLTAVAGGISRRPAAMHADRLKTIAGACLDFAPRLAAFMRERIFASADGCPWLQTFETAPMAGLSLDTTHGTLRIAYGNGSPDVEFPVSKAFDKIDRHKEDWTRQPFYYLKGAGWTGIEADSPQGLFCVGPLARLNSRQEEAAPLAQAERLRLVQALGPFPHYSALAAYWALLVELIRVAEQMQALYCGDDFAGTETRAPVAGLSSTGCAAVEAPEGLIVHRYEVDARGLVQHARIMDAAGANNALKCHLVRRLVRQALALKENPAAIKEKAAMALLPF
jgi:coenzyme F420-reducing hydrogenase alpha subunit